jgi:hypothetical protein
MVQAGLTSKSACAIPERCRKIVLVLSESKRMRCALANWRLPVAGLWSLAEDRSFWNSYVAAVYALAGFWAVFFYPLDFVKTDAYDIPSGMLTGQLPE